MQKLRNKGFTLSELLIVVAIIGVLTAVAIPVFSSQMQKSKIAANTSNAQSLYNAIAAYYMGNNVELVRTKINTTELDTFPNTITFDGQKYEFNDVCTKLEINMENEIQPGVRITQGELIES